MPRKNKCISGCKGFPVSTCDGAPRCSYINGKTYKYCRLSYKYKMGKYPKCNVTRRIKKADARVHAKTRIAEFIRNKTRRTKKSKSSSKKTVQTRLARFIYKNKDNIRTNYLKFVCADSGVCMAFGTDRRKILNFFGGFNRFDYVVAPIKMIGNPSENGFIRELRYEKSGYRANAILKSAKNYAADNLAYEYIVGQFINEQCKSFPCFIETYGMYYYKNASNWTKFLNKDDNLTESNILNTSLDFERNIYNYAKMCQKSKYAAILIEHLSGVKSLGDLMKKTSMNYNSKMNIILDELVYLLYQVYMPLSQLYDVFTHYDLHLDNVLIYEPIKGKYIEYHYHLPDGTLVSFKSPYIAKIIDYGRSFYEYYTASSKPNSTEIYSNLCKEYKCSTKHTNCGSEFGFGWMSPTLSKDNYFISSTLSNPSHDLRLLYVLYNDHIKKAINMPKNIMDMFKKVQYGIGIRNSKYKIYGTKENMTKGYPRKINNVTDAEMAIRDVIMSPDIRLKNDRKYGDPTKKIGEMHIYSDGRPMVFLSAA